MLQTSRADLLQSLKQQLRQLSGSQSPPETSLEVTSTGIAALDGLLPHHGICRGGLVEWLTPDIGMGAVSLALMGVRTALSQGGWWVVIDLRGDFFPAAVSGWGVPLERLLVLRPATPQDAGWAFEQALRCTGVAVAWHWVGRVSERALQRWKVAAESGGGQGILFRSLAARRQASWADVRWQVQPLPGGWLSARRLRVELSYCRGVLGGNYVDLECDDETGRVCLAASLANSAAVPRTA